MFSVPIKGRAQYYFSNIYMFDLAFILKLKTIHKCFLCPYQRQSSMLCFTAFRFSRTPVKSRCRWNVRYGRLHYTNYQYITKLCACVESPHYFTWFVGVSFNCIESSTTRLRPLYITFSLRCEYFTFSCARSHVAKQRISSLSL